MRGMRIAAIAIASAIAFAGCGGSDDSSSTATDATTASITKEEFITQANQICASGNKTIEAAAGKVFGGAKPDPSAAEGFITETVLPSIESQVEQIKALGTPAGEEEPVGALLDAVDADLAKVQADPSLLEPSDTDPFADANKLAGEYGLTECAG